MTLIEQAFIITGVFALITIAVRLAVSDTEKRIRNEIDEEDKERDILRLQSRRRRVEIVKGDGKRKGWGDSL